MMPGDVSITNNIMQNVNDEIAADEVTAAYTEHREETSASSWHEGVDAVLDNW